MLVLFFVFFFNDTATTEIYTLSLHDALPIYVYLVLADVHAKRKDYQSQVQDLDAYLKLVPSSAASADVRKDRKSTRLNSSHLVISYAVFCLKKKKIKNFTALTYGPPYPRSYQ